MELDLSYFVKFPGQNIKDSQKQLSEPVKREQERKQAFNKKYQHFLNVLESQKNFLLAHQQQEEGENQKNSDSEVEKEQQIKIEESIGESIISSKPNKLMSQVTNSFLKKEEQEMIDIKHLQLMNSIAKQKTLMKNAGQTIIFLNLSGNFIDEKFVTMNKKALIELFEQNQISSLNLSHNRMDLEALNILLELLTDKASLELKTLILSDNKLNSQSAESIGILLRKFKSLEKIDLSNNQLGDSFFRTLIDLLGPFKIQNLRKLGLEECGLTEASIKYLKAKLKHFPNLMKLRSQGNQIDNHDKLIEAFDTKLLIQLQHQNFSVYLPQPIAEVSNELGQSSQDSFFTEMSDILTLKYIFEKTKLIIDERVLTLSQERIEHIFPKQNKVISKFLSIYQKSLHQIQTIKDLSTPLSDAQEKINSVQLGNGSSQGSQISNSITRASLELIQMFRDKVLTSNIRVLDLSNNQLSDAQINRGINLLKLCSHKLCILKLSRNKLNFNSLSQIYKNMQKLGMRNLQVLELRGCGIQCICDGTYAHDSLPHQPISLQQNCPMTMLNLILQLNSNSLTHLDLGLNPQKNNQVSQNTTLLPPSLFIKHIEQIELPKIKFLNLSGCFQSKEYFRQIKSFLVVKQSQVEGIKQLSGIFSRLINLELISNSLSYSPEVQWYLRDKVKPKLLRIREDFSKSQSIKIEELDHQYLGQKLVLINDKIYQNMDHLYFISDYKQGTDLSLYQVIDFRTYERFTLIPKAQNFDDFKTHQSLYLKFKGEGIWDYFNSQEDQKCQQYLIFEDFSIPLLDFVKSKRFMEPNQLNLDQLKLSKLILDFHLLYEQSRLPYLFHLSQLVIVKRKNKIQLKLLPFKSFFDIDEIQRQA